MSNIHPSSVVQKGAEIDKNVEIGPFCVIGPNVKISEGTVIQSNVVIDGDTLIGKNNVVFHHTCLGSAPQDLSYKNEPTKLIIGDNNIFREYISVNRGSLKQEGKTQIGNNNLIMAYSHLGHDVTIHNNVRIVNSCNLAGHVTIEDNAIISGATNIGQFIRIGKGAFIGGHSGIDKDVPCYCTALGNRVKLKGVNIIGLRRMGYEKKDISEAVDYYRMMESSSLSPRSFSENEEMMKDYQSNPIVKEISNFILNSKVGIPAFWS